MDDTSIRHDHTPPDVPHRIACEAIAHVLRALDDQRIARHHLVQRLTRDGAR